MGRGRGLLASSNILESSSKNQELSQARALRTEIAALGIKKSLIYNPSL